MTTILNLFDINFHATASSPFISVDKDFVKREKKRVKVVKNILRLSAFLLLSIFISAQGVVLLSSFSGNAFSVIFGVLDLLCGVSGIIWFGFLLTDSVDDLYKIRRRKR